jgi:nitric-oxide synthase
MHAVSAKTKEGIDEVVADIKKQRLGRWVLASDDQRRAPTRTPWLSHSLTLSLCHALTHSLALRARSLGRDVYIVGAANVGKSAFTRAFVKEMSSMSSKQFDPLAIGKSKRLPMESSMPGTTLSSIPLEVFQSGEKLYDTPGLHIHHRMPHILTPDENKGLHPRKRLVGQTLGVDAAHDHGSTYDGTATKGTHPCYAWGGLVRIHVVDAPAGTSLTFFGPEALELSTKPFPTEELKGMLQGQVPLREPEKGFGDDSVATRGGMRIAKKAAINVGKKGGVLADVAVSGIPGWVQVRCDEPSRTRSVRIVVEAPKGIEVFVRPPMPTMRRENDEW